MRQLYNFNKIWAAVKGTALWKLVQREQDLPLALDIHRNVRFAPSMELALGQGLLARPLPRKPTVALAGHCGRDGLQRHRL